MALVTSQVACSAPSMSSSGFISSVANLVLNFPVKKMLMVTLRLGLIVINDIGCSNFESYFTIFPIAHLPIKGALLVPVVNVGRDS